MSAWAGPYLIAVALVVAAGIGKAIDPTMTVGALRGIGLRVPAVVVRAFGAAEAVLGVAAVVTGNRWLALVIAFSYVGFTTFVLVALARRLPIGSCGCFGRVDTPPSWLHVAVNIGAVVTAVAVAQIDGPSVFHGLADQPVAGAPFLVLCLAGAYATFTLLTVVPLLLRPAPSAAGPASTGSGSIGRGS